MRLKGIVPKNFVEERILIEQLIREEDIRSYTYKLIAVSSAGQEGNVKLKVLDTLISLVHPELEDVEKSRIEETVRYLEEEQKKVHTFRIESTNPVDINEIKNMEEM